MYPRNLTLFRFPRSLDLSHLAEALDDCRLKTVGPMEIASRGFVSPFGREENALVQACGDTLRITAGAEEKLLPASVVNELLQKKLDAIEAGGGPRPGARARRQIRTDIIHDLLPKLLVRPRRTDAFLFLDLGLIAVATGSRLAAETVVSDIRRALGSFPALPLNAEAAPRAVLTGWLSGEPMPTRLALGDAAVLRDPVDRGATVKVAHANLVSEEIAEHLRAGRQCTRLAVTMEDRIAVTIDEDMALRGLCLLEGAFDQRDTTDSDDLHAELDARLALFDGEFRILFGVLEDAFQLSKAEG